MDEIQTFLKEYSNELQQSPTAEENIHPKIVSNYCLGKEDVYNQVLDWSLHYLENKKCPYQLAVAIAKTAAKQIDTTVSEQLLDNCVNQEKLLNSYALYAQTLKKLSNECQSFSKEMEDEIDGSSALPFLTSSFEIKNKRRTMEDRHVIIHDLNSLLDLKDAPTDSYYAVFDGHSGVDAASYASAHLHVNMANHPDFLIDPSAAIAQSYKITDENFLKLSEKENLKSGCTAVCALIRDKRIYLSWAGDSQAVLVKGGRPVLVTEPHKPDRPDERKRVEDAGGVVEYMGVWRVNGMLAITRALGDADYRPYISSEAEMTTIDLDGTEDFLVLACDGLFDGMTPEEVTTSLYQNLSESAVDEPLDTLAAKLAHKAKEQGSEDNITTLVVFLRDLTAIRDYASELVAQGIPQTNFLDMNGDEKHKSPCKPTVLELNAASTKKLKNAANVLSSAGFQCPPVYSEGDFDSNMFQNSEDFVPLQNASPFIAPEATALSELPTPPIDDVVASQKFGNICPVELFQGLNSISSEKPALVEEEENAFNSGDFESLVSLQPPPCDQVPSETLAEPVMPSDFQSIVNPFQDQIHPETLAEPVMPSDFQSIVNPFQDQIPSETLLQTSGNNDFTPDEAVDVASCVVSNTIETAVRCLSSNEMFEPSSPVSPMYQLNPFAKPFVPGEMLIQGEPQVITTPECFSENVSSNLEETNTIEREASQNSCKEQVLEVFSTETVEDSSQDILKEETTETSQFEYVLEFNDDNGSKTLRVSSLTSRFSELSILSPQLSATVEKDLEPEISDDQTLEPSIPEQINKSDVDCSTNSSRTGEVEGIFDKPSTHSHFESIASMTQTFTNNSNSTNECDIGEKGEDIDSTNVVQEAVNTVSSSENNLLENVSVNDQNNTLNDISKSTHEGDTVTHGGQVIQNEDDHVLAQVVPDTTNAELLGDSLVPIERENITSEADTMFQNVQVADKLVDDSAMEIKSPVKPADAGFNLESVTFESLNLVGVDAVVTSTEEKLAEECPVEAVDLQTVPVGVPEAEGVTEDIDSDSEKDGGWSYMKGNTLGKPKPDDSKPKVDKLEVTPKLKKDVTKAASDNKAKVRSMTATDKSKKPILDKKVLNVKEKVKPTRTVSSTLPRDVSKSTLSKDASKPTLVKSAADKLVKPSSTVARVKKEATATAPGTKARTVSSTLPKDVSKPTSTKSTVNKSAKPPSTFARIKKEASATTKVSTVAAITKPSRPTTLKNPVAASKPQSPLAKDRVISATVKTTNATTVDSARPKSALATNGVKAPTRAPTLPRPTPSLQSKVAGATSARSTTLSRPASATVPTRALTKPSKPIESKVKPAVSTIKRVDPKKSDVKETKDIVNKQISARKNLTLSTLTRSETTKSATTSNKRAMTLSNKPIPYSKARSVPLKNEANKKDVPKSAGSKIAPKANILKNSKAEKGIEEKVPTMEGDGEKNMNELATPVDSSSQVVTPASEEEKFLLEVNDKEIQSVQEKEKDEFEDQRPHCLENGVAEENVKPLEDTLPASNHMECSAQNV
ncbi:hypothetical protein JTE90_027788 [Oedothorax gibbosus]|uniref:PPM-type phosphatase domain-containing protein n=1 Tax=Oedothorax gibbosus TaxID=931172 RepID=A0AAV6V5Z0_9ARAC|nr:hypothetical protein JTE90_027788 [Oedothorax gibbosus]